MIRIKKDNLLVVAEDIYVKNVFSFDKDKVYLHKKIDFSNHYIIPFDFDNRIHFDFEIDTYGSNFIMFNTLSELLTMAIEGNFEITRFLNYIKRTNKPYVFYVMRPHYSFRKTEFKFSSLKFFEVERIDKGVIACFNFDDEEKENISGYFVIPHIENKIENIVIFDNIWQLYENRGLLKVIKQFKLVLRNKNKTEYDALVAYLHSSSNDNLNFENDYITLKEISYEEFESLIEEVYRFILDKKVFSKTINEDETRDVGFSCDENASFDKENLTLKITKRSYDTGKISEKVEIKELPQNYDFYLLKFVKSISYYNNFGKTIDYIFYDKKNNYYLDRLNFSEYKLKEHLLRNCKFSKEEIKEKENVGS
ncbi:MAG: hypothetical protein ABIL45_04130 [candidate division WOR-3 bacterium]